MEEHLKSILTLEKGLSHREADVAWLVANGLRNKEVGQLLFISEKTVKFHLTKVYKKMAIASRSQLIIQCMPYMAQ